MRSAYYAMLIFAPALLAGFAACGGEDASEEPIEVAEAELRTEPDIIGTFRDAASPSGIRVLTFKTDWTYHIEEAIECIRAPCIGPQANGTYRYVTINGADALELMETPSTTAQEVTYLRYFLKGETLYVAPIGRYTTWQPLVRSGDAWCGVPNDCALQELPVGPCAGRWLCGENVCGYTCRPGTPLPAAE